MAALPTASHRLATTTAAIPQGNRPKRRPLWLEPNDCRKSTASGHAFVSIHFARQPGRSLLSRQSDTTRPYSISYSVPAAAGLRGQRRGQDLQQPLLPLAPLCALSNCVYRGRMTRDDTASCEPLVERQSANRKNSNVRRLGHYCIASVRIESNRA